MISLSLNLRTILIALVVVGIIYYLISSNKQEPEEVVINPEESVQPRVQEQVDSFWTKIILVENESSKVFQYQLPNHFNINPRYLMFHPNFSVSANKMVQIISDQEGEAVAMLNLWVSLNKGLLDGEENFSKLFETSIKRALTYPSVSHKFKIDINTMVHYSKEQEELEKPQNLEYAEDLALNESVLETEPNQKVVEQKLQEEKFEPLNSFNESMALF
jgi:hypothetical protein